LNCAHFLRQYLHGDFKILEAGNGRQGLESAKKYIPDLIVSDIMMPLMDGLEMCALLKKDERTNHIPIILLTARSSVENNIEGLNTGADDYICKPFHAKVLELKIKNLITRQKELQKKYSERIFSFSDEKIPSPEEKFLENIKIIIERHLGDPEFDVNAFAKEINMSRSVLYRKLKALTGQSVNELISNLRLMKAAELLANKSLSVSDVAYAVGFSDPQYFSKCFRKKYNTTPSDFATHKNSVL
jgi:YesN/AraC family two-component response regulator